MEKDNVSAMTAIANDRPIGSVTFGAGPWQQSGGSGHRPPDKLRIVPAYWIGAALASIALWVFIALIN